MAQQELVLPDSISNLGYILIYGAVCVSLHLLPGGRFQGEVGEIKDMRRIGYMEMVGYGVALSAGIGLMGHMVFLYIANNTGACTCTFAKRVNTSH